MHCAFPVRPARMLSDFLHSVEEFLRWIHARKLFSAPVKILTLTVVFFCLINRLPADPPPIVVPWIYSDYVEWWEDCGGGTEQSYWAFTSYDYGSEAYRLSQSFVDDGTVLTEIFQELTWSGGAWPITVAPTFYSAVYTNSGAGGNVYGPNVRRLRSKSLY